MVHFLDHIVDPKNDPFFIKYRLYSMIKCFSFTRIAWENYNLLILLGLFSKNPAAKRRDTQESQDRAALNTRGPCVCHSIRWNVVDDPHRRYDV